MVLQLDSDEWTELGLRDEIDSILLDSCGYDAFRLPRKNHVLGKWVKTGGIYPDYQTRLFRMRVGRFEEREVHESLSVPGPVGTLKHHLLHDGMPNISKQLLNLDSYTRHEANELFKRGQHFRWYHLVINPWLIFFHRYFWLLGFRDGWRGFVVCAYTAIYYFIARAKLWEIETLGLQVSPR